MSRKKIERNEEIVRLRDEKGYSFSKLAEMFGLRAKSGVHRIYNREKKRQEVRS